MYFIELSVFQNDFHFCGKAHNKRTKRSTDVIYGITMPELGISKVIPVDLRELV
jgi:chromosome segregation protein